MISFACTCGQKFDLPESQAGDSFQCPRCMRLVDVPQLSELHMINEDGTFKLYEMEPRQSDLAEKIKTFSYQGDQRYSAEEFLAAGAQPVDLTPGRLEHGPRYDPETGERILPLDIQTDAAVDQPQMIPVATPVLGYATGAPSNPAALQRGPNLHWWDMPWRLATGVNLFGMMFVYLAHVVIHTSLLIPALNLVLAPFALFLLLLIGAHYCNTMEDFGPNGRDRVPVMFRNGSVTDDVLLPLLNVLLAGVMSFGPFVATVLFTGWPPRPAMYVAEIVLFWAGIFFFPAAIFTAVCSGAWQNLMPWRIASVIIAAPFRYLWVTAAFAAAVVAYILSSQYFAITPITALQAAGGARILPPVFAKAGVVYALLFAAVYAMHLAAAWMGLIYQSHYEKFAWILQRHEPVNRTDAGAQLAQMRRRGDPRLHAGRPASAPHQQAAPPQPAAPQPVLPVRSIRQ